MSSQHEDSGKLFVGGLSRDTSQESLGGYFSRFGEVLDCVVMMDNETGRSRGFGFVTFKDAACVQTVIASPSHKLDGRTIDPKCCNPRGQQQGQQRPARRDNDRPPRNNDSTKVFLGGLPSSIDEAELKNHFSKFGNVVDVVIMYDQEKQRSRGFGFVSFETDDSVDRVCAERFIDINGKQVEAKRAEPRGGGSGGRGGGSGGRGGGSGGRDGGGSSRGRYNGSWIDNGGQNNGGPPMDNGVSQQSGGYQATAGWGPPAPHAYPTQEAYGSPPGGPYQGWGVPPSPYGYPGQPPYVQPPAYVTPGYGYGYGWPMPGAPPPMSIAAPGAPPPTNGAVMEQYGAVPLADYGATPVAVPASHVPAVAPAVASATSPQKSPKQDYKSYSSTFGSESYTQEAPSYSTSRARGGQDGYSSGTGDSATPSGGGRGGSHSQGAGYHPYRRQ